MWEISKILTDTKSLINILYLATIKKMVIDPGELMSHISPLFQFLCLVGMINLNINVVDTRILYFMWCTLKARIMEFWGELGWIK